ncbi:DMT family transporter [Rhodocyclus tenuis]|uniref:EamA family transporter n=2 Tax=Rhodocyclus TaxID=1064 RepID=A0A6L5JWF7_RHOTE|nr:DMT family transporter [Rhodocyclus gracilis]MQY50954.1 EamA family transporter [Rhodocyclus gracilis]NJA88664.1 DMT family transporter [Rhodocyclus gracilis]
MSRTLANCLMLLAALIWGTTFVAQQLGMQDVGPLTYTGIRFLIGAVFISPLALREYGRLSARGVVLTRRDFISWSVLGGLLFSGAILQQVGMLTTTVTNAGFLTAIYVPLVPVLAWLVHGQRPHRSTWPAAFGCLAGTYLLSGGHFDAMTVGDFWVIASAFFWAAHVLWVGRLAAHKGTPILVALTQFVVCGLLASTAALVTEPISLQGVEAAMPTILYGGLLSVGVGYTLQVVAQRHTRAADAAILLSSETLFAAIAGAVYLGERLDGMQMAGCALIFACILAVQLIPFIGQARNSGESAH